MFRVGSVPLPRKRHEAKNTKAQRREGTKLGYDAQPNANPHTQTLENSHTPMIGLIRKFLFRKGVREQLAHQKRTRQVHTFESARTVGLLFDATSEKARKESLEFAQALEKQGKKVHKLGFFNSRQLPENPGFEAFSLKETAFDGQPKSDKASQFAKEKFDLLLTLNPEILPALTWVAIQSQASFKIGFATSEPNDYDVQLETPEGKGVKYFTEQLAMYLGKIVLK